MVTSANAKAANWICAALAIVILSTRFVATRIRDGRFVRASYLVVLSLLVLIVRIIVVYYYLRYGTSNDVINGHAIYSEEIKTGSILAVVARSLITTYYWLQICLLLDFYSNLVSGFHWINTIRACWATIAVTYVVVILANYLECRPFRLYYQVDPPPGQCVRAYLQLLTQGTCNIILDLFLLVISYPVLTVNKRSLSQKIRVGALFTLGFFCIIITGLRISYIYAEDSYQPVRSFWATIQMIVSTFVANIPTIYGCFQVVKRRKSNQRTRRASRACEDWMEMPQSPTIRRIPHDTEMPLAPIPAVRVMSHESGGSEKGYEKAWSRHVS